MGAFGEKLRKRREQRGLELEAVSKTTKISTRMLRALEEENFDQLPGGVFNKGFVRAYARQLGLDENELVNEYLAAVQEQQLQAQGAEWEVQSVPRNAVSAAQVSRAPTKPFAEQKRAGSRMWSLERRKQERRRSRNSNGLTAQVQASAQAKYPAAEILSKPAAAGKFRIPWITLAVAAVILATWAVRHNSRPSEKPVLSAPQANTQSQDHASRGLESKAPPAQATSAVKPPLSPMAPDNEPNSIDDVTPLPAKSKSAGTSAPAAFTVLIRAAKTTSVSIVADGQPITQETLIAPAHTSVRATREVVVKVGDPDAVSFLVNGKPVAPPATDAGASTFTFNADGLEVR